MHDEENRIGETDLPCDDQSSSAAEHDRILECRNRSTYFESAWRGLTPLMKAHHEKYGRRLAQEISDRLQTLDEYVRSTKGRPSDRGSETEALNSALAQIDAELDRSAALLCQHLEEATQDRFQEHLYSIDEVNRCGIAAILDFILGVDPRLKRYGSAFDILVTLLSTGEQNGLLRVVRDPSTLTPKLRSLAKRATENSDLDLSKAEQRFLDAARSFDESFSNELLNQMQLAKLELGDNILVPQVLRSAVFFNVEAWKASRDNELCEQSPTPPAPGDTNPIDTEAPNAGQVVGSQPQNTLVAPESAVSGGSDECRLAVSIAPIRASRPLGDAPDVSEVQWRIKPGSPEACSVPRTAHDWVERRARLRLGVTVSSLAAVMLLSTLVWWTRSEGTVQTLSQVELSAVSTELDSGYRSDFGSGPLFVGTVDATWQRLSSSDQRRSANEIISRLGASGAREILIYDDQMRIAVHFAEGLPLRLGYSNE